MLQKLLHLLNDWEGNNLNYSKKKTNLLNSIKHEKYVTTHDADVIIENWSK